MDRFQERDILAAVAGLRRGQEALGEIADGQQGRGRIRAHGRGGRSVRGRCTRHTPLGRKVLKAGVEPAQEGKVLLAVDLGRLRCILGQGRDPAQQIVLGPDHLIHLAQILRGLDQPFLGLAAVLLAADDRVAQGFHIIDAGLDRGEHLIRAAERCGRLDRLRGLGAVARFDLGDRAEPVLEIRVEPVLRLSRLKAQKADDQAPRNPEQR